MWNLEAADLIGNVVVDQLATRPADRLVVAATHGKGVYSMRSRPDRPSATSSRDARMLAQNVPNPFNPSTSIAFRLEQAGRGPPDDPDVAGRRVRTLVDAALGVGDHAYDWSGTDDGGRAVAAGVYVYRLQTQPHAVETRAR